MLPSQLDLCGMGEEERWKRKALRRWSNVKEVFTAVTGMQVPCQDVLATSHCVLYCPDVVQVVMHPDINDLGQMLDAFGLGRSGRAHRADDDVDNLVKVVR